MAAYSITPRGRRDGEGWSGFADAAGMSATEIDQAVTVDARGGNTHLVAAPLTKGSATGEGVNPPGRRQEDDVNIVAFHPTGGGAKDLSPTDNLAPGTGTGTGGTVGIATTVGVRRLTPTECERLQSFPDGWTDLDGTADSKRYSALGDAVTVNVSFWIGTRLSREEQG